MNWKKKYKNGLFILPLVFGAGITVLAKYSDKFTNTPPVGAAFGTTTVVASGFGWLPSVLLGLVSVIVIFLVILYFHKHH